MSTKPFITVQNSQQKLNDLHQQLQQVISEGLSDATATGSAFTVSTGTVLKLQGDYGTGIVRWNDAATTPQLEFSNDNGTTWNTLISETITWQPSISYPAGAIVSYSGALYASLVASNASIPGTSATWRLLTLGAVIRYVNSMQQLRAALETSATALTIYMSGMLTGTLNATITAQTVTLYSDDNTTLATNTITLSLPSAGKLYWYSHGTTITPTTGAAISIGVSNGSMYIDRLNVVSGTLTLSSNVGYQRIDGAVAGGGVAMWDCINTDELYVPLNIAALARLAYSDSVKLYANNGTCGYLTTGDLLDQIGSNVAKYWKVDSQGLLVNRPSAQGTPVGYLYYATDTGDIYRCGDAGWDTGVHIQGPKGDKGDTGDDGSDGFSPVVTMTAVTGGRRLTITSKQYPVTGQSTVILDGPVGATPKLNVGTVSTLSPGTDATVSITQDASDSLEYNINFGIPRGDTGEAGTGLTSVVPPLVLDNGVLSIPKYPTPTILQDAGDVALQIAAGNAYKVTTIKTTKLAVTAQTSADVFGEAWITVQFGTVAGN